MLSVYSKLFTRLNDADIPYCHWKSNEHLEAGLNGNTDLDIIVDRNRRRELEKLLNAVGFKRFQTAAFDTHPSTEDYLGFDEEDGELVHIHLHYRLVLGGDLKQYHLPWTGRILETRQLDEETNVYVSDPNVEMFLLLVRYALKLTQLDYIREFSDSTYPGDDIRREYEWLQPRIDEETVTLLAQELLAPCAVSPIRQLLDNMCIWKFRMLRKIVCEELKIYRTFSYPETWLQRRRRELLQKMRWHSREDFGWPGLFRRTVPTGGVIVAIVGPDGSGKSTSSTTLSDWLSWKLDVYQMYMGSNDAYSVPRRLLRFGKRVYTSVFGRLGSSNLVSSVESTTDPKSASDESSDSTNSVLGRFWDVSNALLISYEKRKKLSRVWRARNKGAVVITDRFPQNEVMGINDGPLLNHLSNHPDRSRRRLARWERRPYEWAEKHPPDLIIKLIVDPETSIERDPDGNLEEIRKKCEIVHSLSFGNTSIVEVDASRSKNEVSSDIKQAVWEEL